MGSINRQDLLEMAGRLPDRICPFCGEIYEDDAEYVYIDLGHYEQVSPNHCEYCNAYELGCWKFNPEMMVHCQGWVRERQPGDETKYPNPSSTLVDLDLMEE